MTHNTSSAFAVASFKGPLAIVVGMLVSSLLMLVLAMVVGG